MLLGLTLFLSVCRFFARRDEKRHTLRNPRFTIFLRPGGHTMPHPHRTKAAAQRAALLFFVAGLLAVVNSLRAATGAQLATFIALGVLDLVIAMLLYVLPWERWYRY